MSIDRIVKSGYDAEYLQGAKEALTQWDANGDGKTSASELNQNTKALYANIFAEDENLSAKASKLADAQAEIYSKYAGDDGILDETEYANALNSKENNALLDEYWKLRDELDGEESSSTGKTLNISDNYSAEEIYGKEYMNEAKKTLKRTDADGDGKTTVKEFYKNILNNYKNVFGNDKESFKKAKEIAKAQKEVYSKYAGDDGILSSEEYVQALNSKENSALLDEYWALQGNS